MKSALDIIADCAVWGSDMYDVGDEGAEDIIKQLDAEGYEIVPKDGGRITPAGACECCGASGRMFCIQLSGDRDRYYLPNQNARKFHEEGTIPLKDVSFCVDCMRALEDNFRATIGYLKAEKSGAYS